MAVSKKDIQFEAHFANHFWGIPINEALESEAVNLLVTSYSTNFDSDDTRHWLQTFLPSDLIKRQQIARDHKRRMQEIKYDDASYQNYCYEYTGFAKQWHTGK